MSTKELIIDPSAIDYENVVADIEEIRRYIPQRDAMEQLTAIVVEDPESQICVGYRDLTGDEFWYTGHMPSMPLMPGVIMCEAAAQVCSYYTMRRGYLDTGMMGFGGLDKVRFRGMVRPGQRFTVACEVLKVRPKRMINCRFQGFVKESIVCEGELIGIALPANELEAGDSSEG